MTRAQHQVSQEAIWPTLFEEHRATLIAVAEMLLNCPVSPEHILDKAMAALEGSPVRENFAPVSAIRAVVKATVAHNCGAADSRTEAESQDPAKHRSFESSPGSALPWPERAVYFLRGVLRYSRRDTALLLGMSDASIDQLYEFAEKRIRYSSNTSFSSRTDVSDMSPGFQEGPRNEFQLLFQSHRRELSAYTMQLQVLPPRPKPGR